MYNFTGYNCANRAARRTRDEGPETPDLLREPASGGQQRSGQAGEKRRKAGVGLYLLLYAGGAAGSARLLLCASARSPLYLSGHGNLLHVVPYLSLRTQLAGAGAGGRLQLPGCAAGHGDVYCHLPVPGASAADGYHPEREVQVRVYRRALQKDRQQHRPLRGAAEGACGGFPPR